MNRAQKISWSIVITMSLGLILAVTAFVILYPKFGMSGAFRIGFGLLAIGGLGGLSVFIFKKDKGKVTRDERDELIEKNSFYVGLGAVYLLVILVSYLPIGIAPEAQIPTKWFPFLLPAAVLCQAFAQSIAILIQYGWGGKNGEK